MAWIEELDEEEASGRLKEIYDEIREKRGKLSNIMKVQSLSPKAMEAHMDLYLSIMFEERKLSREECEMIGVVVSAHNGCDYCVNHHAEALNHYWKDEERLERLKKGPGELELSERKEEMLSYVGKLTEKPSDVQGEDIEELRKNDFSDEEILNINMIASYFNFVNRIAEGLGVDFSEEEVGGYNY